jgi:hypothetical protein
MRRRACTAEIDEKLVLRAGVTVFVYDAGMFTGNLWRLVTRADTGGTNR